MREGKRLWEQLLDWLRTQKPRQWDVMSRREKGGGEMGEKGEKEGLQSLVLFLYKHQDHSRANKVLCDMGPTPLQ